MLTLKLLSSHASDGVQFLDIRNQLPVNPHYTWAQLAGIRPVEALNTIVCHHDGIPKYKSTQYSDIALAKRIATDHINSKKNHPNGDPGFPYDVWIRNGTIYWCNDIEPREYGVANNNGYTVNVCVSGDYANFDQLTDADRKALYAAILMLKEALPADKHLKGHKELSPTACPGFDMNKVRSDIANMEAEIAYNESAQKQDELAFRIANQILYFYKMAKGEDANGKEATPGQVDWAKKSLLKLEPEMRRLGFLK